MQLVAASNVLTSVGIMAVALTLLILFGGSFLFAKTQGQRMANLLCGFLLAATSFFLVFAFYSPTPNSWGDKNFSWIVIGIVPIAAGVGVALARGWRFASRRAS